MSANTSKKQIPITTAKSIRSSSTTSTKSNDSSIPHLIIKHFQYHFGMLDKKKSQKQEREGLFLSFHGDRAVLDKINLKVQLTIVVDKPFVTTLSMLPLMTEQDWKTKEVVIEPLVGIEVFGFKERDFIIKSKGPYMDNTLYIYFPQNTKVTEVAYKNHNAAFKSMVEQLPKSIRSNFTKLILFEEGAGEHSVENQSTKCSDMLTNLVKNQLEKRIDQYTNDIAAVLKSELTIKGLFTIFKSKYGLAYLYRRLGVNDKAKELMELLWLDMVFNQKLFTNPSASITMLPPYIDPSFSKISKEFFSPSTFLKICSFSFLKSYELDLQLMSYCQAIKALKKFIEVSWNNLQFRKLEQKKLEERAQYQKQLQESKREDEMLKNMWVIALIDECNKIAAKLGRTYPTFLNVAKEGQYNGLAVSVARTYKMSLEMLGKVLYQFQSKSNYPQNLQKEIELCFQYLQKTKMESIQPSFNKKYVKMIANGVTQNFLLIFGGYECFRILYLKSLVNFYQIMSRTKSFLRMARSLKLLVLKAYLSITQPEKLQISQDYIKQFGASTVDINQYIDSIIQKAEKLVIFEDQSFEMHAALYKKTVRYSIDSDIYINRNRQDETLWPSLKFIEDYYKFIVLLQCYRAELIKQRGRKRSSFSLNFGQGQKGHIKSDNIIHLLFNQKLMELKDKWEQTLKLVREIFILEKGEDVNIQEGVDVPVRLGILLEAKINTNADESELILRLNNQELLNLDSIKQHNLIQIQLLAQDTNSKDKKIDLRLLYMKPLSEGMVECHFHLVRSECLIFIIKQLQVKVGAILCYYVNKSIQIQEMKQMEEPSGKKKSRKYSFLEEKLKEQQFVHLINKSSNLTMNHLHYHTFSLKGQAAPKPQSKDMAESPYNSRRSSQLLSRGSQLNRSRSSRSNSQASLLNMMKENAPALSICKNIWTPLFFKISPNYKSQTYNIDLLLQKMVISTAEGQQVSPNVRINGKWVDRTASEDLQLKQLTSEGVEVVLMARSCVSGEKDKKQRRKQSQMSQGMFSGTDWEKSQILGIKMDVRQEQYQYLVQGSYSYGSIQPLQVRYFYCDDLEQYTLTNVSKLTLQVKTKGCTDQQILEDYILYPKEQVRLLSSQVQIAVQVQKYPQNEDDYQLNSFFTKVDLKDYIRKELQKPLKIQNFDISVKEEQVYRKMELIYIKSSIGGTISILDSGRGFQLVGKVQGQVQVDQQGLLNLYLLPVTSGKLILPRILIDYKKGNWTGSIFLNVQQ